MNPIKGFINVQNAKVLRLVGMGILQLCGMGRGKYALASVEIDVDDALASKVVTLQPWITAGAGDHGTTVHVYKHLTRQC